MSLTPDTSTRRRLRASGVLALVVGLSLAIAAGATACTRVLWNDNSVAVLASRSMDWWGSSQSRLHVMPRGLQKSGSSFGKDKIVTENPARWTSKYGSVVVGNYDAAVSDGMNEKGLGAHGLWL